MIISERIRTDTTFFDLNGRESAVKPVQQLNEYIIPMKYLTILLLIMCVVLGASAQSIEGRWKTVDDVSGKARSVVEIFKEGDNYFGKIIKFFPEPGDDPDPVCTECKGKKNGQKIVGLQIIEDMEMQSDGKLDDGKILDPENGKVYDCKMWVEEGTLKVRGYLLFLYRTQTWLPYDE